MGRENSDRKSPMHEELEKIETRAEELVRDGQARAKEAIERAKQEAKRIISDAERDAVLRAELIKKKGLLEIEREVADALAAGRAEADELARRTSEHTGKAVEFIIRLITGAEEGQKT